MLSPVVVHDAAKRLATAREVEPVALQEAVVLRRALREAAITVTLPWRWSVE